MNPPSGCYFNPRCPVVQDKCRVDHPELLKVSNGDVHMAACHYPSDAPLPTGLHK